MQSKHLDIVQYQHLLLWGLFICFGFFPHGWEVKFLDGRLVKEKKEIFYFYNFAACAAAFARHRGKTGTLHLLQVNRCCRANQ